MRHQRKTVKLQRSAAHRKSMLSNQVCSLIEHRRIKTTLAKAKATKPIAEKMVTLGKRGTIHARRQAAAFLKQKGIVQKLFAEVAPASEGRQGGYCRITKLGPRFSDAAPMAYLEWVDYQIESDEDVVEEPAAEEAKEATAAE